MTGEQRKPSEWTVEENAVEGRATLIRGPAPDILSAKKNYAGDKSTLLDLTPRPRGGPIGKLVTLAAGVIAGYWRRLF